MSYSPTEFYLSVMPQDVVSVGKLIQTTAARTISYSTSVSCSLNIEKRKGFQGSASRCVDPYEMPALPYLTRHSLEPTGSHAPASLISPGDATSEIGWIYGLGGHRMSNCSGEAAQEPASFCQLRETAPPPFRWPAGCKVSHGSIKLFYISMQETPMAQKNLDPTKRT